MEAYLGSSIWAEFDVQAAPLARFCLIEHAKFGACIAFVVHSFIADGVSANLLALELQQIRDAGRPSAKLPPTLNYLDYLDAINQWMDGAVGQGCLMAVVDRLKDLPQLSYPIHADAQPVTEEFQFDPALAEAIRITARTLNTSPFTLFLAAQSVILSALADSRRIALQAISNGRATATTAKIIGRLADPIFITIDVSEVRSFQLLVGLSQEIVAKALKTPFVKDDHLAPHLTAAGIRTDTPVFNYIAEAGGGAAGYDLNAFPPHIPPFTSAPRKTSRPYYLKILDNGKEFKAIIQYGSGKIKGFSAALIKVLSSVSIDKDVRTARLLYLVNECFL